MRRSKISKRTPEIAVPESQWDEPKQTPWGRMNYIDYKKRMEFDINQYKEIDLYCKKIILHGLLHVGMKLQSKKWPL